MVGKYQQKLADTELRNTQLEVDNDILQQQVLLLQSELQQYKDREKDVDTEAQDGDSEQDWDNLHADHPVQGPGADDEFVTEGEPDLSTVEEVAAKHTS